MFDFDRDFDQAAFPSLDHKVLGRIVDLAPPAEQVSFLREIVDLFKTVGPEALRGMEAAVRRRDARAMLRYSHLLKGACLNMGVRTLGTLCQTLELNALAGQVPTSASDLIPLGEAFQVGLLELDKLCATASAA